MPHIITVLNLDNTDGQGLIKEFLLDKNVENQVAQTIEKKVLNDGGWIAKDEPGKISVNGEILDGCVRRPKRQPFEKFEVAIDAMDYVLLIKIGDKLWQKTRFKIHTLENKPDK